MSSSSDFQSPKRVKVPRTPIRRNFLLTHSSADMKKFPTRESFSNAVVHCFDEDSCKVEVCYWAWAREPHPNTSGFHYHMAIKMIDPKRWNLVKRKLQENHGTVVNFSTSHDQYYYAFRYIIKEDQEYVKSANHPSIEDEIKHLGDYNKECERETEIMSVWWNVFKMSCQIPAEDVKDLVPCPRCFSNLVFLGEQNVSFFYEYM